MSSFDLYCKLLDIGVNDEEIMHEVLNYFSEDELKGLFESIMRNYDVEVE